MLRAGLGRRARLRWVHLVLGGALLMPYYLLCAVLVMVISRNVNPFISLAWQLAVFVLAVPVAAVTGLVPLVRTLEASAVRWLCDVPGERLAERPADSWDARSRTSLWYALHLAVGGLVSALTLALTPAALLLLTQPMEPPHEADDISWVARLRDGGVAFAPLAGLLLLAGLIGVIAAAGSVLARCAPVLLGATPGDQLAAARRRATELAVRNRLARELHDSVGHALSAVTLQASAARRVLDCDPEFARRALAAIEDTTRDAVSELDGVLGLLREDGEPVPATEGAAAATAGTARGTSRWGPVEATEPVEATGAPEAVGRKLVSDTAKAPALPAAAPLSPPGAARHGFAPRPLLALSTPTLADLTGLLDRTRAAGGTVALSTAGPIDLLPPVVSREAYRIVQEGLSNALRHAGDVPVRLCVTVSESEVAIQLENPVTGVRRAASGGGRGLRGIAERAALLHGSSSAGVHDGVWQLMARLPLGGV
ncbi:signal transduction histidine kinase [Streptomyces zagrosensis]|uniref:histidine kinase n=2 Tax=Streptomyces zagrosensis TaxID=1042984 RepID=A0A7W9UWL2_9ACTN|nr:signal transduction histidine kinase [Streptomyces zagrosensis]